MTEPDILARALDRIALPRGARVLDVGCGYGDVTAAVAERVGPEGRVVGLDRDPTVLEVARERAAARGHGQVEFRAGSLDDPPVSGLDAITGRRVLMYQPDPVAAVRGAMRALRPGGIVLWIEHDASVRVLPSPGWSEHARVLDLVWRTIEAEGGHPDMGRSLYGTLVAAGLRDVRTIGELALQLPGEVGKLPGTLRYLMPRMIAAGTATPGEIDPDAVERALVAESARATTVLVTDLVFVAWGVVGS